MRYLFSVCLAMAWLVSCAKPMQDTPLQELILEKIPYMEVEDETVKVDQDIKGAAYFVIHGMYACSKIGLHLSSNQMKDTSSYLPFGHCAHRHDLVKPILHRRNRTAPHESICTLHKLDGTVILVIRKMDGDPLTAAYMRLYLDIK